MADPTLNDPLLREIDDDLRRERLERLWRRYGGVLIAAAVALVLAVAAYQGWQAWQQRQRAEAAAALSQAMAVAATDPQGAASALTTLAKEGPAGYPVLAGLQRAALLARQGDTAAALDAYRELAARPIPPLYRDLAAISAASLSLAGVPRPDAGQREAVRASLLPLAADGNPWRFSARELLALIALDDGQGPVARELLGKLVADPQAPPGVRQRVEHILGQLGDHATAGS